MGARIKHDDELVENHEINVTPFIDVMLVLLIIFMVAAPLATVDIKVDLPPSTAEPQPIMDEPVYLTIEADHNLSLGNDPVALDTLAVSLRVVTEGNTDRRLFLRADKSVDYETLMQTMSALQEAGYLKVALVALEGAGMGNTSGTKP